MTLPTSANGADVEAAVRPGRAPRRGFAPATVAVALAGAGLVSAALAPRGGAAVALVVVPAVVLGLAGWAWGRLGPATVALAGIGAAYCIASASHPVRTGPTAVVAVVLFVAFLVVSDPVGLPARSRSSALLVLLSVAVAPVVLVLAQAIGEVSTGLYVPALIAGVAAVAVPLVVAARRR